MGISNAEWEIMRVIWSNGEVTSADIFDILGVKKGWSVSTIKTLLRRLVEKGYLITRKDGKAFRYSSVFTEDEVVNEQVGETFDKFCQKKHFAILEHLLHETPMTAADIASLQSLLENKQSVPHVACQCIKGQCRCDEDS